MGPMTLPIKAAATMDLPSRASVRPAKASSWLVISTQSSFGRPGTVQTASPLHKNQSLTAVLPNSCTLPLLNFSTIGNRNGDSQFSVPDDIKRRV